MILEGKQLDTLLEAALNAGRKASAYIQSKVDNNYVKQIKDGGDSIASQIVTEIDVIAQQIIVEILHPSIIQYDIGLLTEESVDDHSRFTKDYFWCIDPIDGTLPFTERRHGYAVSIALIDKSGAPVIGVAAIPDKGDIYHAIKGQGLYKNGQPFHNTTYNNNTLSAYLGNSMDGKDYFQMVMKGLEEYAQLEGLQLEQVPGYGGVVNHIYILEKGCGCFFKLPKSYDSCGGIWDYGATRLFFEEAGAYVSDAQGDVLNLNRSNSTYMNQHGVIYASDSALAQCIIALNKNYQANNQ